MGKFKVGDKVRVIDDAGGGKLGDVCAVTDLGDDGYIVLDGLTGGAYGLYDHRLELVTEKWQPKVGDRVTTNGNTRVNIEQHWDDHFRRTNGDIINGALVVTSVADHASSNVGLSNKVGRTHFFMPADTPQPAEPTTLTIEAGKFYKTRDGRKVGPATAGVPSHIDKNYTWTLGTDYYVADGRFFEHSQENEGDLIAEWVDEPVKAGNDNAASIKFKVGDRVRFRSGYASCAAGNEATVVAVNVWGTDGIQVDQGGYDGVSTEAETDLELVTTTKPTAIVALIEGGQPKPASRPYVHATEASAREEADRLASVHKGRQFGVYVLTTTSQEAAPTYKHEWQRLAVAGRKIDAIKELRGITGLGLKSTKDAVEHWLANDEPRSRIAA